MITSSASEPVEDCQIIKKIGENHVLLAVQIPSPPERDPEKAASISLNGHKLTAHRNQLKMIHQQRGQSKVFITMGMKESEKLARSISEDDDLLGLPDVPMIPENIQSEKKHHVLIRSPVMTRSKAASTN
ncbi:uncharacterized protein LOC131693781 [Topomyia yanbarensis]|uniref:uncharacterized protein LOC131693781 n=1 Tax=Topomyia yanbarensis TaxID=2498891 RepID=UPI00273CA931|nr:uncharacterized protein LOC131693781 [Topomyia yanbarensis]